MKNKHIISAAVVLGTIIVTHSVVTYAAGFMLIEQGTKGLGSAFAGAAAEASDSSTIYFNPAGMTRVSGRQVASAAHVIIPSVKFSNDGSRFGATALTGDQGGNGAVTAYVPNFYFIDDITSDVKLGLGINVPFGLTTEYDSTWQGRYQAIKSDLVTLNINPSIAYKINSNLSFGAGISAQQAKAELTSAVDLRALLSSTTQDADATAKITGSDWGYGYNFGLLYELNSATRIGAAYRSQVAHTLKGNAVFTPTNATATAILPSIQASGSLINTTARAKTVMPENISIAGYHQINNEWALLADATWTRWSRFKELRVHYDSGQADSVTPEDWNDSWRYGAGINWKPNGAITYRAGLAYDATPVPNADRRSPRVPDNTRRWIALGASYQTSKSFTFDVGYAHLFESNAPINNTDSYGHKLIGTYSNSVNILSGQVNWTF